ncbi:hypothetical protein NX059_006464 [Plenodomus lindquistii]|nr:hypothetical protein NX059_006464 [Plenodomus lindquistii]
MSTPNTPPATSTSPAPPTPTTSPSPTHPHKSKSSIEQARRTPPSHPSSSPSPAQTPATPTNQRSIWDPDDSEWETNISSTTITSTFTTSFHAPVARTASAPSKASALGKWGSTVRDTWRTIRALSPTKRNGKDGDGDALEHRDGRYEEDKEEEEEVGEKLERLRNAYYSDPEGDLHDQVMRSCFVQGSKYFCTPPTASPRYMHVLALSAYFCPDDELLHEAKPRLNIAIPTVLSHTSTACLTAFLDPRIEEFIYRRYIDRSASGLVLVVRRCGNKIIAGAYTNFGFKLQWVAYVKSVVGVRGEWVDVYAAVGPGYTDIRDGVVDWDMFWPDGEGRDAQEGNVTGPRRLALARPGETGEVVEEGISPQDPKFVLYQSRVLGKALLGDIWMRFEGLNECRATWEADGVVKDVRLQRSLLGVGDDDEE